MKVKHHNQEIGEGTVRLIHIDSIVATGGHFAHKTCAETVLQLADFFVNRCHLEWGVQTCPKVRFVKSTQFLISYKLALFRRNKDLFEIV